MFNHISAISLTLNQRAVGSNPTAPTKILVENQDSTKARSQDRAFCFSLSPASLLRDIAGEYGVASGDMPVLDDEVLNHLANAIRRGCSPRKVRRAIASALARADTEPRSH